MTIKQLFERKIDRPINGVVKADQVDATSVWQELDEFVVTQELSRHFSDLIGALLSAVNDKGRLGDRNGVWISGFFGCGKSHLIKVLSYLLENTEHTYDGQTLRAVDFFAAKFDTTLLFADLKKAVSVPWDTILFNIDSKADHKHGRDALLQVFLKVLNEKQGFSSDHPHIAHMERYLAEKGKLEQFHAAFKTQAGTSWLEERDAYEFHRDQVIAALSEVLGQSERSVEKWVDSSADNFSLTPENFAKWVARYLESRGPDHQIMFLVDEVGQFIGGDGHLMLSLQTITEELATLCSGRAWVVVTSQEDLDAVLGELKSAKQNDFSKIQGRFKTRLSLSSRNVDEVIKKRLLAKTEPARQALAALYQGRQDILKNQLSFAKTGHTFRTFHDVEDFTDAYPFAAYQFHLVQKVFESIRKAGATGLHLSQGERSTLDAFQGAVCQLSEGPLGGLAPFYLFYPAVEGFLDTSVKRTIDQTADNPSLRPFDNTVLKVLFLIRYLDILPGLVDNLVTLCVNQVDADRLAIRKEIEASLNRLEQETLISRNGDQYFFLTNEERDIGREIKNTPLASGSEAQELGRMLFQDMLGDQAKHTYSKTRRDFSFSRLCDDQVVGRRSTGDLEVAFLTPMADDYANFPDDGSCLMHSAQHSGRVFVRLPDHPDLGRELRTYLQTESYVRTKNTGALPETTKRILRDRSDENRLRRARILEILRGMLGQTSYYACGTRIAIKSSDLNSALADSLEYLITNAYPKMGYIEELCENPKQEIQRLLRANDLEQHSLQLGTGEANPRALAELRGFLRLSQQAHRQVVLFHLVEEKFAERPYGWPQLEVIRLVTQLLVTREIELLHSARPLKREEAYEYLVSPQKQRSVMVSLRESADLGLLKKARTLGQELFAKQGQEEETALYDFLKGQLQQWQASLNQQRPLAQRGGYPGGEQIEACLESIKRFLNETDSLKFLKRWVESNAELQELCEDIHELQEFYQHQIGTWDSLRGALGDFEQNRFQLEQDTGAASALKSLREVSELPRPYPRLKDVAGLIATVRQVNDRLLAEHQKQARTELERCLSQVRADLEQAQAGPELRQRATKELEGFLGQLSKISSIPHLNQAVHTAELAAERALKEIESATRYAQAPSESPVSRASLGDGTTVLTDGPTTESTPVLLSPPPRLKPRRVVEPRKLCGSNYLETKEQVDLFLAELRRALETALENNERVQIK